MRGGRSCSLRYLLPAELDAELELDSELDLELPAESELLDEPPDAVFPDELPPLEP